MRSPAGRRALGEDRFEGVIEQVVDQRRRRGPRAQLPTALSVTHVTKVEEPFGAIAALS